MVIVQCQGLLRHRGRAAERRNVELAMSQAALTGLLYWLEASPIYPIWRASLAARRLRLTGRRGHIRRSNDLGGIVRLSLTFSTP
jgi:hypothetical protein